MSDRLDIDALLIGRLYGELDEADEARLQAHLESHPADRTALADMTRTRESVRESRITTLHHEPPQSISALLLQEAARRAPKQVEAREGWFARFVASLRHPAMAAAMTLVVVASFAGIVYVKKGDHFAEQSKSETTVDRAPVMSAPSGAAAMAAGSAAPSPEPVATDEARGGEAVQADGAAAAGAEGAKDEYKVQLQEPPRPVAPAPAPKSRKGASRADTTSTLEVTTGRSARQPQDLADDEAPAKQQFAEPPARDTNANAPGMAPDSRAPVAPAPPPPPPEIGAVGGGAPAGAPKSAPAAKKETTKEDSGELAWARTQHARVVDRARAGNCSEAASIAVQLSNRAPGYYTQYVQNDRQLKQCFTAINRERELDAERAQKARARRSEEPMPRPADSINSPK